MVLGEKLFEENGNIIGVKVVKVHPIEGVTTDVSFTSEIRGEGIPKRRKSWFRYNDKIFSWHN